MNKLNLLLSICFIGLSFALTAQSSNNYVANYRYISVDEGLSHRDIRAIHKDKLGLIWLGTKFGLNRFDGHHFKIFLKEKNNLASNEVELILEDSEDWLWLFNMSNWEQVFNVQSLSFINIRTHEVQSLEERFGKIPFDITDVFSAISDDFGQIWLGLKNGDLIKYTNKGQFEVFKNRNPKNEKLKLSYKDQTVGLVGSYFSENNQKRRVVALDTINQVITNFGKKMNLIPIGTNSKNESYLIGNEGLINFNKLFIHTHRDGLAEVDLPNTAIDRMVYDWLSMGYFDKINNWVWHKSITDLSIIDPEKGLIYDFNTTLSKVIQDEIHIITFDKNGSAYIGTANGLYVVKLEELNFRRLLYKNPNTNGFNKLYSCRQMTQVGNDLYVNTNNFRQKIDLNTGNSTSLGLQQSMNGDKSDFILTAINGTDNNIWFGESILSSYSIDNNEESTFLNDHDRTLKIWCIYQATPDELWLGLENNGFTVFNTETKKDIPFNRYNKYEILANSTIYQFEPLDKDNFLLATTSGLYILNKKDGVTKHFWTEGNEANYFPGDNVFHIHKDKNNHFWIGTGGSGLVEITLENLELKVVNHFTIADGLSNNTIYGVYEDKHGWLWMSSDYGIIQFNKETHWSKAYLPSDGVNFTEYNRLSHYQADDGKLYFGSINGVTAFHPSDFWNEKNNDNSKIIISEFLYLNGKSGEWEDETSQVFNQPKISLNPQKNSFSMSFTMGDYLDAENIHFAYRIKSVNDNWIYLEKNTLQIWQLPAGNHVLEVKGQRANGQFSKQHLEIPIRVLPPFYLRWWFLLLAALVLGFGIRWFLKEKTKRLEEQKNILEQKITQRTATILQKNKQLEKDKAIIEEQSEELRQLDEMKSRFFANVSHELRTPLTLILGPLNTMLNSQKLNNRNYTFASIIQKNAQQLLKRVNEILDLTKLENSELQFTPEVTTFYPLMRRSIAAFESYAQDKGISFKLNYQADQYLQLEMDVAKFERILENLLSNAFKFTSAGREVKVVVKDLAKQIEIQVIDTGQGIHPDDLPHIFNRFYQSKKIKSNQGTGIGLAFSQELVRLMKGKLWAESKLSEGTTFFWTFPKHEALGAADLKVDVAEEALIETPIVIPQTKDDTKPNILIVEDNFSLRQYLEMVLNPHFNVRTAENGAVGLERLKEESFSFIISDVMMPIMDGFEFLEKVKSQPKYQNIPMVMLTAKADMSNKLVALRLGVDDYLLKPFDEQELLVRIQNLLNNAQTRLAMKGNKSTLVVEKVEKEEVSINKKDQLWLKELDEHILKNITKFHYNVEMLAENMLISRQHLNVRIKTITGLTAVKYLQEARLNTARQFLENQKYSSVKATALEVGFKDVKYFSKIYKKRYGKLPSSYYL